jgi:hypothetical protein
MVETGPDGEETRVSFVPRRGSAGADAATPAGGRREAIAAPPACRRSRASGVMD